MAPILALSDDWRPSDACPTPISRDYRALAPTEKRKRRHAIGKERTSCVLIKWQVQLAWTRDRRRRFPRRTKERGSIIPVVKSHPPTPRHQSRHRPGRRGRLSLSLSLSLSLLLVPSAPPHAREPRPRRRRPESGKRCRIRGGRMRVSCAPTAAELVGAPGGGFRRSGATPWRG
jgi:hypothetical protein